MKLCTYKSFGKHQVWKLKNLVELLALFFFSDFFALWNTKWNQSWMAFSYFYRYLSSIFIEWNMHLCHANFIRSSDEFAPFLVSNDWSIKARKKKGKNSYVVDKFFFICTSLINADEDNTISQLKWTIKRESNIKKISDLIVFFSTFNFPRFSFCRRLMEFFPIHCSLHQRCNWIRINKSYFVCWTLEWLKLVQALR